jgi:hypothetical protein
MPRRRAASTCPTPSGFKYSSRRSSPGGIAGPSQSGFLVIVFDADFVGMSVLPPKGDAVLIIDPDAITTRLVTLQILQPVTGRNRQIVEARSGVERRPGRRPLELSELGR